MKNSLFSRIRTYDPIIKSDVLYQLSYKQICAATCATR